MTLEWCWVEGYDSRAGQAQQWQSEEHSHGTVAKPKAYSAIPNIQLGPGTSRSWGPNCFFTFLHPPPFTDAIHWPCLIVTVLEKYSFTTSPISTSHTVLTGNYTLPKWLHHFCLSLCSIQTSPMIKSQVNCNICACASFSLLHLVTFWHTVHRQMHPSDPSQLHKHNKATTRSDTHIQYTNILSGDLS